MNLSFNSKMEAYYQKFIELQEKLRKSEEERLKLEMKFNEMLQVTREEEQTHYKKLRSQYKRFLEEDRKRQERNERIIRTLERIEARVNMLTSRTDRFKMLKRQYQSYIQRISHMRPVDKTEHPSPKIEEDASSKQQTRNISEHHKDMPDHLSLKKAMGKSNEEKIEILDKYLQSLVTQKCRDTIDNEEKDPHSDLSQLKYLDSISKKMDDGFNSNQANSIAEDIMNSIYSRHYKKDLYMDEAKKASKFTTSNYLNDGSSKQKSFDFGDSYNTTSALENLDNNAAIGKNVSFDEFRKNRPSSNFENSDSVIRKNSEFDGSNKNNYTLGNNIPKSLGMYNKQADNNLSKNKDYHTEVDPLVKGTDYKSKAHPVLNNEEYKTKDFTRNDSQYLKSNQNQSQVDPLFKGMAKISNPDALFKDADYQTKDYAGNDYPKTNQSKRPADPLLKSMEYINKADQLHREKDSQSKDFTANDSSEYLKSDQRVKFENLEDDMAYVPSKTEIDITESEKQLVSNYPIPCGGRDNKKNKLWKDIYGRVVKQQKQIGANQREIHSKLAQNQEYYDTEFADNEINNRDKHLAEHSEQVDNKLKKLQINERLIRQEHDLDYVINNERQEIETTIPDEQFEANQSNHDVNDKLVTNIQHIPKYEKKIDIQSNEGIQDEYVEKQVINEDQAQYIENESPIQYDQYEEPIQYDQFGNQIMYDENGQVIESQYDENAYNQGKPYDEAGQQNYNENKLDVQYNENGEPIPSYDQQYGVDEQPILYDQQYDPNSQPVQQLYDENGQAYQQYDQSGQLHSYNQDSHPIQYDENGGVIPQYDENGQLIQQYDGSGQPMQLYDQSNQPEYAENTQPIQEYGENEQPIEQYNQEGQLVQEYEQPIQQYENEQPVEQYNQGDQSVQEYEQPFQQYDANGQPIPQYDENGQLIYQCDENVQPLQQYDENGQLIHQYDENSLHQYNENDQLPEEYDGTSQPILQGENVQLSQDVPVLGTYDNELEKHDIEESLEDKTKTNSSKSTVKEDINSSVVEETSESQPVKQKNVLDMLDTDTESVKQNTSKVSNDSDFDFSNG